MNNYKIEVAVAKDNEELNSPSYISKKLLLEKGNVVFLGLVRDGNNLIIVYKEI